LFRVRGIRHASKARGFIIVAPWIGVSASCPRDLAIRNVGVEIAYILQLLGKLCNRPQCQQLAGRLHVSPKGYQNVRAIIVTQDIGEHLRAENQLMNFSAAQLLMLKAAACAL
jgi:hypothetical protein